MTSISSIRFAHQVAPVRFRQQARQTVPAIQFGGPEIKFPFYVRIPMGVLVLVVNGSRQTVKFVTGGKYCKDAQPASDGLKLIFNKP